MPGGELRIGWTALDLEPRIAVSFAVWVLEDIRHHASVEMTCRASRLLMALGGCKLCGGCDNGHFAWWPAMTAGSDCRVVGLEGYRLYASPLMRTLPTPVSRRRRDHEPYIMFSVATLPAGRSVTCEGKCA